MVGTLTPKIASREQPKLIVNQRNQVGRLESIPIISETRESLSYLPAQGR